LVVRESDGVGARTVYFLAPDYDRPAGGVQTLYRHVDILNSNGIPASILHNKKGFRCTWFHNRTRVTSSASVYLKRTDLLVVGELDVDIVVRSRLRVPHLIFNQGPYLTWQGGTGVADYYANGPRPKAIITVSEHSVALLSYAFPGIDVRRVRLGIDTAAFKPPDDAAPRVITYMPRRGAEDVTILRQILDARGALDGWRVSKVEGLSHAGVAHALRSSQIFLATSIREGFGLPAAEAMACGNYVVGFDGLAGREYFLPEFCSAVDAGDLLAFSQALESVIRRDCCTPGWLRQRGLAASRFIASTYSRSAEEADVLKAYADFV
jgi:hypothetical protein